MGYHTEFEGHFELNKKLDEKLHIYLTKFSETRRMKRKLPKEFGVEGEYYVDGTGVAGQDHEDSVTNSNAPPSTQPGLWCQWTPSDCGKYIEWDGGEKFYEYIPWLRYIILNFLKPQGYVLNGAVDWQGEDPSDVGTIEVIENVIANDYDFEQAVELYESKEHNAELAKLVVAKILE